MHYPTFSFTVHVFQCTVDFLHLGRQCGKLAANVRGHLFMAMGTSVFLDMLRYFFGNHIVVSEQVAEERGEFVTMMVLGSRNFHRLVVVWVSIHAIWGIEKCRNLVNSSFFVISKRLLVELSIATDVDNFLLYGRMHKIFFSMKCKLFDKKSDNSAELRFRNIPHWK